MDFSVSIFTKEILEKRTDDLRIDFLYDILFGDRIRNLIKENESFSSTIRPAKVGDKVTYLVINDEPTLKLTLEQNIININKLMKDKQSLPIRNTWIIILSYSEEKDDINTDIFCNPNASDCKDIIENTKNVVGSLFAVEYDTIETVKLNRGKKESEMTEVPLINYLLLAPLFQTNVNEYNEIMRSIESDNLKRIFWIDFTKNKAGEIAAQEVPVPEPPPPPVF